MKIIKHLLKIYDREYFGYYKYIATLLFLPAAFIIGKQYGFLLLFSVCAMHAYGITTIYRKYQLCIFLQMSGYSLLKQNLYSLLAIIARNFIFLAANMLYLFIYFKYKLIFVLCFSLLLYAYSTLLGILMGKIVSFYYIGLSLFFIFTILLLVANQVFHESSLRFISPVMQLYYPDQIHLINIASITILCVFLAGLCFWSYGNVEKTICLFIALIAMMFCLLIYEKNHANAYLRDISNSTVSCPYQNTFKRM